MLVAAQLLLPPLPSRPVPPRPVFIAALMDRIPSLEDTMSCCEFAALLSTAMVRLHTAESSITTAGTGEVHRSADRLPEVVAVCVLFFEAEQKEVHKAAAAALTAVFLNCVPKEFVASCLATPESPLHKAIRAIDTLVQYKFQV
jgi:hypothetical protein